jgi:hypothetical protein
MSSSRVYNTISESLKSCLELLSFEIILLPGILYTGLLMLIWSTSQGMRMRTSLLMANFARRKLPKRTEP